ncbi:cytochrome P450 CYP749A22-like isoform X2 [Hevea brasiliensis]|nr:cytochrome P450 CYP749A22-like isoform X2 [Hevea brasiliensis]
MNYLSWHGPEAHLVVTEPNLVKEIFNNKDGAFPKPEPEEYFKKLLGDGIVTTRGEKWFTLRKLSNHAFHAECLKGMIPAMIASVEIMLERWKYHDGKEIDAFQEFKVLTSEIISRTAFGSSYMEGQDIFDMLIRMVVIISRNKYKIRIPGISNLVKTADDVESDKLEQGIRDSIINMMKRREEAAIMGQSSGGFGSDFLGLLLKEHHDDNSDRIISVEDVIDECKTFYVAGHETTSSSITWTLLLLAIHIDWQDKARKEVLELFGQQNPTPDGLARLKTMNMIINEALRLYPPAVNVPRQVQRQVRLGKLILPENMVIEIPVLAIHHNPQIWGEDVHLFKPERFAEGLAKATNNNVTAYLPFGLGPRSCVGSNFAITETKIALSMILQRYQFTLSPTYVHSPITLITLCPQHGLQIRLQPLHLG